MKYVLGFVFDKDFNKVVLIKKNKPDWQKGKLNGIGGKIENGEEESDAMTREFLEEAGVFIHSNNWHNFATLNGSDFCVECFTAVINNFDEIKTMEEEEIYIYNLNEPLGSHISNLSWLIPMAKNYYEDIDLLDIRVEYK